MSTLLIRGLLMHCGLHSKRGVGRRFVTRSRTRRRRTRAKVGETPAAVGALFAGKPQLRRVRFVGLLLCSLIVGEAVRGGEDLIKSRTGPLGVEAAEVGFFGASSMIFNFFMFERVNPSGDCDL